MVLEDVIILLEGGYASGGTSRPLTKQEKEGIAVAARKLLHKTRESVELGLQQLKEYTYNFGSRAVQVAKDAVYNQIVRHPERVAALAGISIPTAAALRGRIRDFAGRMTTRVLAAITPNILPVLAADLRRTPAHVFPDKDKRLEKYPHGYDRLRPGLNRLSLFNTLPVLASGIKGAAAMNFARYREPQPQLPQLSPNSQQHYYNFFHTYTNPHPAYLVNPALID